MKCSLSFKAMSANGSRLSWALSHGLGRVVGIMLLQSYLGPGLGGLTPRRVWGQASAIGWFLSQA